MRSKLCKVIIAGLVSILVCFSSISAEAAKLPVNTLLDHPDFGDKSYCPDNRFYNTDNIHAAIWSYGYECNTLNLNGIDDVVDEVLNVVSKEKNPLKYKNRWFSLWTEGADMSKKNLDDLYDAGWNILGLTYYDYWIETVLQPIETDFYEPRFSVIDDESVRTVLAKAGFDFSTYKVGMIRVSGVSMPCRSCAFYCPDFSFLKKKTVYGYKFYPEAEKFVKLDEVRYNGYKKGFLDIYYGKKGKEGNGLFVFTTVEIPEGLTASEDEIQSIIDSLPRQPVAEPEPAPVEPTPPSAEPVPEEETQPSTEPSSEEQTPSTTEPVPEEPTQPSTEPVPEEPTAPTDEPALEEQEQPAYNPGETPADEFVKVEYNENDQLVAEWRFKNGNVPANFSDKVSIKWTGANEVTADFDYSGSLPQGTTVTLYIPFNKSGFKNGDTLYLYYCNPKTGLRELSGTGVYDDGLVSFTMPHCSEYLITNENRGETFALKKTVPFSVYAIAAFGVCVLLVLGVVFAVRKRRK